jgi:hypothetical protein
MRGIEKEKEGYNKKKGVMAARKWKQEKEK